MSIPIRWAAAAALLVALGACAEKEADDGFVRGPGLKLTQLPVASKVAVYDVALRSAFDLGPGLVLMLDPRFLPRESGLGPGRPMPKPLIDALRQRRVVHGICEPPAEASRQAPVCEASGPGYIVRFSDVFRMGGDSVQLHIAVERFNTRTSMQSEILRFEKAFQVVGNGTTWRVARQGRFGAAARANHLSSR